MAHLGNRGARPRRAGRRRDLFEAGTDVRRTAADRTKWVASSFGLPRTVHHPLITRKVIEYNGRYHHVVNLRSADDLDDDIRDWLTEAYFASPE